MSNSDRWGLSQAAVTRLDENLRMSYLCLRNYLVDGAMANATRGTCRCGPDVGRTVGGSAIAPVPTELGNVRQIVAAIVPAYDPANVGVPDNYLL